MHIAGRFQRLLALLTVVLATAIAVPLAGTSAASPPLDLFVSPQTGYFFFWDATTWSKSDESSDPGFDSVRLQSKDGVIAGTTAFIAPGLSPDDCVRHVIDNLLSDLPHAEVEALSTEGGPPRVEDGFTELVLTVGNEADREKYAVHIACDEIVPQQSLVATSFYVPARLFNERGYPLWFYGPIWFDSAEIARTERNGGAVVIPDREGQTIGTLAAAVSCVPQLKGSAFFLARNVTDGSNLTIDPSSFVAVGGPDETVTAPSVTWWLPAAPQDAPLVLSPGETALFQIAVDSEYFDLSYTTSSGQTVSLGTYFWSCGAGGAAPVLIDIE